MTPIRFAALADAYGADIARWPAPERDAARAHLRADPGARAVLDDAALLDRALDAWSVPPPPPFLDSAIAARVLARTDRLRRIRAWLTGSAAAAALAGGLATGIALGVVPAEPDATSTWYHLSILGAPLAVPADAS